MKKNRIYFQIVLVMAVLVVLYIIWPLPFRYFSQKVIIPAVGGSVSVVSKLAGPFKIIGKIQDLDRENKSLEDENLELKSELAKAKESENKCVSQIDEKESIQQLKINTIQASVIGKSPFSFNQVFIINRGFDDGVREKSAVISQGYLLGQIIQVDHKSATLKLVTSHDSLIPAITLKSRQSGIVQGGLEGLALTDIPVDANPSEGETVVTSGMGGEMPLGISIGEISEIRSQSGGLFKDIKIKYPINPNNIEVVSVVVDNE